MTSDLDQEDKVLGETERGQYVRLCIEINMRKSLISKVKVRKIVYKVEYEGLNIICFNCGTYGHFEEDCLYLSDQGKKN